MNKWTDTIMAGFVLIVALMILPFVVLANGWRYINGWRPWQRGS
jgi:hypothetical protein